jgi:hypothetical protein
MSVFNDQSPSPEFRTPSRAKSIASPAARCAPTLLIHSMACKEDCSPRCWRRCPLPRDAIGAGEIVPPRKFGDCRLHVEWATPRKRSVTARDGKRVVILNSSGGLCNYAAERPSASRSSGNHGSTVHRALAHYAPRPGEDSRALRDHGSPARSRISGSAV